MNRKYLFAFFASIFAVAILLNAVAVAFVFHRLSGGTAAILAPCIVVVGLTAAVRSLLLRRREVRALAGPERERFDKEQLPKLLRSAQFLKYWLIYLPFGILAMLWETRGTPFWVGGLGVVFGSLLMTLIYRSRQASLAESERITAGNARSSTAL